MSDAHIILRNPNFPFAAPIELSEGTSTVGRDPTCQIVLSNPSVSRVHAELEVREALVTVRDLKSRNGTYVAGKRVDSAEVQAGQRVFFGCVQFMLETANSTVIRRGDPDLETRSVSDVFEGSAADPNSVPLSKAERRVFDLILGGLSEKEVAHRIKISRNTVHCHVQKIYRVLDVRSRAELLARFVQQPPPR
jgi:pSer/pThr/pTyr-binding forkhead associated (FHA) protein